MTEAIDTEMKLWGGMVESRRVARIIGQYDLLEQGGVASYELLKYDMASSQWSHYTIDWPPVRQVVAPDGRLFVLGADGRVLVSGAGNLQMEHLDPTSTGPSGRGLMRDMRWIGTQLFAAGMSRQVYRRREERWERCDRRVLASDDEFAVSGFNAIAGCCVDDVLAVGFDGEIWHFDGRSWREVHSPTNLALFDIAAAVKGRAHVCGQKGLLLERDGERWTVIEQTATEDDLWGISWFAGTLYVSSQSRLFYLKNGDLKPAPWNLREAWTFDRLCAKDGLLWSFGTAHVAWTSDGRTWVDATP